MKFFLYLHGNWCFESLPVLLHTGVVFIFDYFTLSCRNTGIVLKLMSLCSEDDSKDLLDPTLTHSQFYFEKSYFRFAYKQANSGQWLLFHHPHISLIVSSIFLIKITSLDSGIISLPIWFAIHMMITVHFTSSLELYLAHFPFLCVCGIIWLFVVVCFYGCYLYLEYEPFVTHIVWRHY